MHYSDKREAKVRIMHKLVENGWKAFGYSPDQSDSMTDYFHPAHWDGIATKNGYVLLIDICNYNLSYSGKEIREYNYNSKRVSTNERITKLTAMMNDTASTENEKASCAVLIEKEKEKAGIEPDYTVKEVYPVFSHVNPKGTSWHIEKDGQIIAKGKGVFSTNTYDWDNEEKSEVQQKEEKITAFINRVEKVLSDSDALQAEVIKVPVKTIQTVEKDVTLITEADIKEGFTFVMKAAYTHGKNKGNKYSLIHRDEQFNKYHTFAKLGKNNKPSKSMDKSWSLSVARINELLGKGHIAVIEFIEITEYVEKTVFKKTTRKQTVSDAPQIETTEEVDIQNSEIAHNSNDNSNESAGHEQPATKKQLWALHCATKLNTTNLKIDKIKASELITRSKQGHDILSEVKSLLGIADSDKTKTINNDKIAVSDKTQDKHTDKSSYIAKIDKQIESAQKKLNSLSGDYLTNTWKRQNEEVSREKKRENLRFDLSLLEHLKDKAINNRMSTFDVALLNGQLREDLKNIYNSKAKYNHVVEYPVINPSYDKNNWWNLEVPKWQKRLNKAGIFNTEQYDKAIDEYGLIVQKIETPVNPVQKQIKELESKVRLYKIDGYFPTPKTIVQQMIDLADIQDGESILEPSAGNGNILDGIRQYSQESGLNVKLEAIEWNHTLCQILELKQYEVISNDFTEFNTFTKYDKVIMNPPFEKNQDVDHVLKAYKCLKDGGKIVAIMSPHWTFAKDSKSVNFRNWINDKGYYEKLPEGTFKESGTGVNTVLVVIDKLENDSVIAN